jgi:hypothetical protein
MLLPGKTAARFRLKAAVLTARFLAGDMALVGEIYAQQRSASRSGFFGPASTR